MTGADEAIGAGYKVAGVEFENVRRRILKDSGDSATRFFTLIDHHRIKQFVDPKLIRIVDRFGRQDRVAKGLGLISEVDALELHDEAVLVGTRRNNGHGTARCRQDRTAVDPFRSVRCEHDVYIATHAMRAGDSADFEHRSAY